MEDGEWWRWCHQPQLRQPLEELFENCAAVRSLENLGKLLNPRSDPIQVQLALVESQQLLRIIEILGPARHQLVDDEILGSRNPDRDAHVFGDLTELNGFFLEGQPSEARVNRNAGSAMTGKDDLTGTRELRGAYHPRTDVVFCKGLEHTLRIT